MVGVGKLNASDGVLVTPDLKGFDDRATVKPFGLGLQQESAKDVKGHLITGVTYPS